MASKPRNTTGNGDLEHHALELWTESNRYSADEYFLVKGRIVGCEEDGSQESRKYYCFSYYSEQGKDLHDFTVSCQTDKGKRDRPESEATYAWQAGYIVTLVTVENAERMARVLKAMQAKLDHMTTEDGHADNFGVYVARVCKAVGITRVRIPCTPNEWNGDSHHVVTPGLAKDWINHRLRDFLNPRVDQSA